MDKVYYYNRNGVLRLTIGEDPYHMLKGTGEFKDNQWEYEQQFGNYRNFRRSKSAYPFSIIIKSKLDADFDALCDIFSEDVIAGAPGYFLINGWKLECYVVKAQHSWYSGKDYVVSFEALAVDSTWTRSETKPYNGNAGGGDGSDLDLGRDYSYAEGVLGRGYNYGYSVTDNHYAVIELTGSDNGYEVLIYGPQVNPAIYLNGYPIQVNINLLAGETLRIVSNGRIKTIKKYSSTGIESDAFVYRDKEHTPFISLGQRTELTFGQIKFDFTSIERRSEPSWT